MHPDRNQCAEIFAPRAVIAGSSWTSTFAAIARRAGSAACARKTDRRKRALGSKGRNAVGEIELRRRHPSGPVGPARVLERRLRTTAVIFSTSLDQRRGVVAMFRMASKRV